MKLQALVFLIGVIVASAATAWFGAVWAVRSLETDTLSRIEASMDAAGQDWAEVEADGLIVRLQGTAPDETGRFRALEVAAQIVDTNRIKDETTVASRDNTGIPDFTLEILRNDPELSLIGLVPGKAHRIEILQSLGDLRVANEFTDLLESAEHEAPAQWIAALDVALEAVRQLPKSRILVKPGGITIEAFLSRPDMMETTQSAIKGMIPEGVDLKLELSAPKSVVAPFRFSATAQSSTIEVLECWSNSEVAKTQIYTALADISSEAACPEALGVPTETWPDAIAQGLKALSQIPSGELIINDTDVELIGERPTTPEEYETAAAELARTLPAMFSLRKSPPLEEAPVVVEAAPMPELVAVLANNGDFTLTGPMRDTTSKTATENFSAARFGQSQLSVDLKLSGNTPAGWSHHVLAALDALSLLHDGQVTLTPETLALTGRAAHEDTQKIIEETLREQLGPLPFNVAVEVVPELAEVESGASISARECERQLASVMREAQIIFDPSSSTISDQSELLLDQIAFIISSCPDARFEIGGHTDSQGRDVMNLSLSQARAEAVLNSLIARKVFLDQLEALGYGETEPIADNDTEAGRTRNRRIAFKLLKNNEATNE